MKEIEVVLKIDLELWDKVKQIVKDIFTQDSHGTQNPIFYQIREPEIVYGVHEDFSDGYVWVDQDDPESSFDPESDYIPTELADAGSWDDEVEVEGEIIYIKRYYRKGFKYHNSFLTQQGAEQHLERNRHNYAEGSHWYIDHSYRNQEQENLHAFFKAIYEMVKL